MSKIFCFLPLSLVSCFASLCCVWAEPIYKPSGTTAYFHSNPAGSRLGTVYPSARMKVTEEKGNWYKAEVEMWFKKGSIVPITAKPKTPANRKEGSTPITPTGEFFEGLGLHSYSITRSEPLKSETNRVKRAILTLVVKNTTDKVVRNWRGILIVKEKSGKFLFRETVSSGGKGIPANGQREYRFGWTPEDEEYHTLLAYEDPNRSFDLKLAKVELK